jgi:hypothetical protein
VIARPLLRAARKAYYFDAGTAQAAEAWASVLLKQKPQAPNDKRRPKASEKRSRTWSEQESK